MRSSDSFARCDRPTSAFSRTLFDQPGRLAHGPEEKLGLAGARSGFFIVGTLLTFVL